MQTDMEIERAELRITVALRLRAARTRRGWTQEQTAECIDRQPAQYGHYEQGTRTPSLATAVRLADALGVSLDWLTARDTGEEQADD